MRTRYRLYTLHGYGPALAALLAVTAQAVLLLLAVALLLLALAAY